MESSRGSSLSSACFSGPAAAEIEISPHDEGEKKLNYECKITVLLIHIHPLFVLLFYILALFSSCYLSVTFTLPGSYVSRSRCVSVPMKYNIYIN